MRIHGHWIPLVVTVTWAAAGCGPDTRQPDAYGNFEAREIAVSAEVPGKLMGIHAVEGQRLEAGAAVAQIDSTQLHLQRRQLAARLGAVRARYPGITAQQEVVRAQLEHARRELRRLDSLVAKGAATQKQHDDAAGQVHVLEEQLDAAGTQRAPVLAEVEVLRAQLAQVDDQISRTTVSNPAAGVVLIRLAEQSELVTPGRPLYRLARLDTLELRAYLSGSQLAEVTLGDAVEVAYDGPGGTVRQLPGRVSWVASEAEFTPKMIQTREERVNLVYAFKIRVPNPDGHLKIGMPGEVFFRP